MGDIRALGYLRIDTTDLDRWRTLAHDVLDLGVGVGGDDDTLHLRLDERARRNTLRHAEKDNLDAVGWEKRDEIALDRVRATLTEHGIAYRDLTHDETQAIKVDGAITLDYPAASAWRSSTAPSWTTPRSPPRSAPSSSPTSWACVTSWSPPPTKTPPSASTATCWASTPAVRSASRRPPACRRCASSSWASTRATTASP